MFGWYWLADRCAENHIPFVLGHALYTKLIHVSKAKNEETTRPTRQAKIDDSLEQPVSLHCTTHPPRATNPARCNETQRIATK